MNNLWYHLIPKGSDLSKGILSPQWMITHHMETLALYYLDKYRDRMVSSWNIYPDKEPNGLSIEELFAGLEKFRGKYGKQAIYAFRYPLASQMGPNMKKVLRYKDIYEIDISKIPDLIMIDYNINGGKPASWYDSVTQEEYFSTYDDNAEKHGKLLFAGIPHVAIITTSGRIPPQAIRKLEYIPLYHGSSKKFTTLKPFVAKAHPENDTVYATASYEFALAYCGNKWDDLILNQSMINGKQVLTEILPGTFKKIYDTKGYMHYLTSEGFYEYNHHEWVSIWEQEPYKIETIPNVLRALERSNTTLYKYPNLPNFIPDRKKYIWNLCRKWNVDPTSYFKAIEK